MSETKSLDWQDDKNLPECMLYMLENEIMCDVTLRVGEDKTPIKAHKYMLSSRSPVFYTMFEGSLPETGEIDIPDVDVETFRDLLKYIYSDKIDISINNVTEMLYASDKYMMTKVKTECMRVLKQIASSKDAVRSLQTAHQYSLEDLQNKSLRYIIENTQTCLLSEHCLCLSKECVELILKSDILNCSETNVCSFFLKWARFQRMSPNEEITGQNLRTIVGPLLYLIRFPLVDMKFFSSEIGSCGLLTDDENLNIYQAHFGGKSKYFLNKTREPLDRRPTLTAMRSENITNNWNSLGVHALKFQCNDNLWLKGVIICSPYSQQYMYLIPTISVSITIFDENNQEKTSAQINMSTRHLSTTYPIKLIEPIQIISGKTYTIKMTGMNVPTYYCTNCKGTVSTNGITFTFENTTEQSETTTDQGQFAGLTFSL